MSLLLDALNKEAGKSKEPQQDGHFETPIECQSATELNDEINAAAEKVAVALTEEKNLTNEIGSDTRKPNISNPVEIDVIDESVEFTLDEFDIIKDFDSIESETDIEDTIEVSLEKSVEGELILDLLGDNESPLQEAFHQDNIDDFIEGEVESLSPELESTENNSSHDEAPLLTAYRLAREKRKKIARSIVGAITIAFFALVYSLFFYTPNHETDVVDGDFLDENININAESNFAISDLTPIDLKTLPKKKSIPTPNSKPNQGININIAHSKLTTLNKAYSEMQQGNLNKAIVLYRSVLNNPIDRIAALSGLSNIAIRQNNKIQASKKLLHILELDANNSYALSTLAALSSETNNTESISQLKNLHDLHPSNASIVYLLGNVFATRKQWGEARNAYSEALHLDIDNPDYSFNLAVSLDQLGDKKLATKYYKQALQQSSQRTASFNKNVILSRLN